jgi:hypothetical protein
MMTCALQVIKKSFKQVLSSLTEVENRISQGFPKLE